MQPVEKGYHLYPLSTLTYCFLRYIFCCCCYFSSSSSLDHHNVFTVTRHRITIFTVQVFDSIIIKLLVYVKKNCFIQLH